MSDKDDQLVKDALAEARELVDGYSGDPDNRTYRFALALLASNREGPAYRTGDSS